MRLPKLAALIGVMALTTGTVHAGRTFVHPGISYTQGQLDRMKAMVEAKAEPYYTTYLNMLGSEHCSLTRTVSDRGTQIADGQFNGTVGIDGRCAHDLALLWHITGDRRYADKAVAYLNANNHYTNTSARGTGPLDNGKINLLIEAAELMRDYDGWEPAEQQKFKDMLTYPYYSQTEDLYQKLASMDNSQNGITFYWNICNGDPGRFGNQGMFGMLAMLAMGVYLDNEVIYERALNYVSGLPHRADDLPYPPGPPVTSTKPIEKNQYQNTYELIRRGNDIEDYGYDELLQYYFYPNGQCSESSRDQGHVMAGLHKYIEFAEIAWNQGDEFYSLFDNRLLKAAEFNIRYNLTSFQSYPDQPEPWEPAGYTDDWDAVTLDNDMYLQTRLRSGRWETLTPSPDKRGSISNVGSRESAYSHYAIRCGEPAENTKWLQRARDYVMDQYGYETSGTAPNWFYEWNGWGTLTKTLEPGMAGDPVTYANGTRISGIHYMPGTVCAADYDYYNFSEDGEGHTYHKVTATSPSAYRPEGAVALKQVEGQWAVCNTADGEWMKYTIACPVADTYDVYVTLRSGGKAQLGVSVAEGDPVFASVDASPSFTEQKIANIPFPAGASVLKLTVKGNDPDLEIASIRLVFNPATEPEVVFNGRLNARDKQFETDWTFTGIIVDNTEVLRSITGNLEDAEVIARNPSGGFYTDTDLDGNVPGYTYWLRYTTDGETLLSEPRSFKWGLLEDTFDGQSEWTIPGANGTGAYAGGAFNLTCTDAGAARFGRSWSFPFHAGNYPVLAFCIDRPEGMAMALYSGSNSWLNGYDTYTGKVGDNVYYYDLTAGAFQNSKGVDKTTVAADAVTSLPLQLRFAAPANAAAKINWAGTFASLDDLKAAAANPEGSFAAVDVIVNDDIEDTTVYNLMGMPCGDTLENLPRGIYIRNGKKILVK